MGKGSMKLLVSVGLILLLACSWYMLLHNAGVKQKQYDEYLKVAREKAERDLKRDVIENYNLALQMRDSLELRTEIADYYKKTGQMNEYVKFCEEGIKKYPRDELFYVRMAEYYLSQEIYSSMYTMIGNAERRGIHSERLTELKEENRYKFQYTFYKLEDVGTYSYGLCVARRQNGQWGYVDTNGQQVLSYEYEEARNFNGKYMSVKMENGEFLLVDPTGREQSKDLERRKFEDCTYYAEDKIAVKYDGKYHYCDFEFNELFGSYEYAGAFNNERAAVMNGGKWFLIDSNGEKVGNKDFDEIKVDESGIAFRNEVAFAKTGGKYILIDTSGNQVGSESWADVDCFNSDQPAAVSNGKLWGFVDASGKMLTEYKYENAKSFSNGFAAISEVSKWGYIILDDYSTKIECQYEDARDFTFKGTAFIMRDNKWDMIKIYSYR